jgi:NAD(P) transhydrogenase
MNWQPRRELEAMPSQHFPIIWPYAIQTSPKKTYGQMILYTIPEISMVGHTEEQLTQGKIPYEVGLVRYAELVKSQMLGDEQGLLKLLFDPENLRPLGVQVIGDRAAETVHICQAVLTMGGTLEYFRDTVFNYPTLAKHIKLRLWTD